MSKVVFVGNVPYNFGEDQLKEVFESVGQVVGFRLVFDRETGKPKGYGFAEFADHETAMSAVRNLNNQDVGGRPLRIDIAESDPFLEGKTTVRGALPDGGESRSQWREREERGTGPEAQAFLAKPPAGPPVPQHMKAVDMIAQTVNTMPRDELRSLMSQMKTFIAQHPEEARTLLNQSPQLSYAMFQGLVTLEALPQSTISRMLEAAKHPLPPPAQNYGSGGQNYSSYAQPPPQSNYPPYQQQQQQQQSYGRAPPPPPPAAYNAPPASTGYNAPPPASYGAAPPSYGAPPAAYGAPPAAYNAPPPPPMQQYNAPPGAYPPAAAVPLYPPAAAQAQHTVVIPPESQVLIDGLDPGQRAQLMQVIYMRPEEIAAMPAIEQQAIHGLRKQFLNPGT